LIGPDAGNEIRKLSDPVPASSAGVNCSTFMLAAVTVVGNVPGKCPIAMFMGSDGVGGCAKPSWLELIAINAASS
jgi:hypothetical protein